MGFEIAIMLASALIAILLAYISFNLNREVHGVLAVMFLIFALTLGAMTFLLATSFLDVVEYRNVTAYNDTTLNVILENTTVTYTYPAVTGTILSRLYELLLWIGVITIFWFILILIYNAMVDAGRVKEVGWLPRKKNKVF